MNTIKNAGLIIIITLLLVISGCASTSNYTSDFDNAINIDGIQSDWKGKFNNIKDANIGVGFKNDEQNLYICLVTGDRMNIMKILKNGVTIWLNPENGETIGIRYPINYNMDNPMEDFEMKKGRNPETEDPGEMINKIIATQNEISIVNDDNFPIFAFNLDNREGFDAKLGYSFKQLVYELKIPLSGSNNSKITLDALPNEEINISFETGEMERPKMGMGGGRMPGEDSGEAPPEDNPGMGMGGERPGRGPGDMGKRGNMGKMTDKIDFKCLVKLSSSANPN